MKKSKVATFLIVAISVFFLAGMAQAAVACPSCPEDQQGGFVPCGRNCNDPKTDWNECEPCGLCHFFIMFDSIADFVLFNLVPPIGVLLLVSGGIMFFLAGGDPMAVGKARKMVTATVIGLAIIYGSWLIISTFLTILGVAEWTGLGEWFKYPCF